jgi:hypothetical protein
VDNAPCSYSCIHGLLETSTLQESKAKRSSSEGEPGLQLPQSCTLSSCLDHVPKTAASGICESSPSHHILAAMEASNSNSGSA